MSADAEALREEMVPVAADLVCRVRDLDGAAISDLLIPLDGLRLRALAVVLAAMVPDSARLGDLLAWVDDLDWSKVKRCTRCGQPKPFDAFTVDRSKPDGRRGECRHCTAARRRAA